MSPSALEVHIRRALPPFLLSADLRLEGGILVLFGQSGAGKTQTLECVAGLRTPDRGVIRLGDRILFRNEGTGRRINLPPRRRRIGYVMQDGALFPHMSVLRNVAYGIRRHAAGPEPRAMRLLEEMGIGDFAGCLPRMLSGGQQRRAAIARALATDPDLLLLDEPFVHLDRVVRGRLVEDLRSLVRVHGIPAILVTHDIEETAACADLIAVMEEGAVVQHGPRDEVLFRPASRGIATLLGDVNVLPGIVRGGEGGLWRVETGGVTWRIPQVGAFAPGTAVEVVIRSHAVKIIKNGIPVARELAQNLHRGRVLSVSPRPGSVRVTVALAGGTRVTGIIPTATFHRAEVREGEERDFAVDGEGIRVFRCG